VTTPAVQRLTPAWVRGYERAWLRPDVLAGLTLAAVAIPECMGYTSIAQTPIVTGLYTIIFPTLLFVLLGSSKLLVVGADSATAAILAAGLAGLSISGLSPGSSQWVAFCGMTALVCGVLLLLAHLLRLGFIGDFLAASVLIGFLTGVGISVLSGQIPGMLGVPKGSGNWFHQQWAWISDLTSISWSTAAFAAGALAVIVGCKRFAPRVPGAIIAVIGSISVSAATDAKTHGVSVVGAVTGGFPPIGLPDGISWTEPDGGLFTWLTFPRGFDAAAFMAKQLLPKAKVAFVPGATFFPVEQQPQHARVSFSGVPDDRLVRGVTAIGTLLRQV